MRWSPHPDQPRRTLRRSPGAAVACSNTGASGVEYDNPTLGSSVNRSGRSRTSGSLRSQCSPRFSIRPFTTVVAIAKTMSITNLLVSGRPGPPGGSGPSFPPWPTTGALLVAEPVQLGGDRLSGLGIVIQGVRLTH